MFFPPLFHMLKIHSLTFSPYLCLNELAHSLSSLVMRCTSSWTTLSLSFPGNCLTLNLAIGLEATIGGYWERSVLFCQASPLRKVTSGLAKYKRRKIHSLRQKWKRQLLPRVRLNLLEAEGSESSALLGSFYTSQSKVTASHFLWISALTLSL